MYRHRLSPLLAVRRIAAAVLLLGGVFPVLPVRAATYVQNFNYINGTVPGGTWNDGAVLTSPVTGTPAVPVASVQTSALRMTMDGVTNATSLLVLPELDPGLDIIGFSFDFTFRLQAAGTPGTGFSVNFGGIPPDGDGDGELGFPLPGGLAVGFKTFVDTEAGMTNGEIAVYSDRVKLAVFSRKFDYDTTYRKVTLRYDAQGLDIVIAGTNVVENLALPGFVPRIGDRFAFSARTALLATEELSLDAFSVKTTTAGSIATGGFIISEFVADNQGSYEDEDVETSDWIEIYNGGATSSLAGWILAADPVDTNTWWTFPNVTVNSNAYRVVFASGKDRPATNGPMHTSFTLQKEGGYLALLKPDHTVVSEYTYGPQKPDVSYGEIGAARVRGYMETPTPAAKNVSLVGDGPPAESVVFSRPGGLFLGPDPVTLSIAAPLVPGAVIRYTLNNTVPSSLSPEYTQPFVLTNTATVRARVFLAGHLPGKVSSRTFIKADASLSSFTNTGKAFSSPLPVLVMDSYGVDIDSANSAGSRPFRPIYAVMFDTDPATRHSHLDGAPDFEGRGGLHVRGESSSGFDQRSYAWEIWDNQNNDTPASILGMPAESDWILHGPWSDKTLMRNYIAYSTMHDTRSDYAGSRTRFVEVFLNQERGQPVSYADYRGVYLLVEKIKRAKGRVNIQKLNSLVVDTNLITGGYIFKTDKASVSTAWSTSRGVSMQSVEPQLLSSAQLKYLSGYVNGFETALGAANGTDPVNGYAAWIDVPSFIDAEWWVELTKQVDGYVFSTYYHKDRGAKWKAGPVWDFNISLGNADYATGDVPVGWMYGGPTDPLGSASGLWYPALLKDPEYKLKFFDRYWDLRRGVWGDAAIMGRIDDVQKLMLDGVTQPISNSLPLTVMCPAERQYRKYPRLGQRDWPNPPEATGRFTYQTEVAAMKQWLSQRLSWLDDGDLVGNYILRPPAMSQAGGLVPKGSELTLAPYSGTAPAGRSYPPGTVYYTTDGTDPRPPAFGAPGLQEVVFIPEFATASYFIPTIANGGSTAKVADWTSVVPGPTASGLSWQTGQLGLGFDDLASTNSVYIGGGAYTPGDIRVQMQGVSSTVFIRVPFVITPDQLSRLNSMTFKMRADDGFIAFLNGVEIARANVTTKTQPTYDAVANLLPTNWRDALAAQQKSYTITNWFGHLAAGNNVLSILGINASVTDDDAMFSPSVVGTLVVPPSTPITSKPYTAPLTLGSNMLVKARTYFNGYWGPLNTATYFVDAVPASSANLVVSELMYSPAPPTAAESLVSKSASDYEFIEFLNTSALPVDLTQVRITSGVQFNFSSLDPLLAVLPPGERIVVCAHHNAFTNRYGAGVRLVGPYTGSLNNSGETLTVVDRNGAVILSFTYSNQLPWPVGADGTGYSIVLDNPAAQPAPDPSDPAQWRLGAARNGRPGAADSVPLQLAPFEDPDGDGLPNLLEYAIGSNPQLPSSRVVLKASLTEAPTPEGTGLFVTFEYRRNLNADGIQVFLQTSSDLSNWAANSGALEYVGMTANNDGTGTVTWRTATPVADADLPFLFVRLAVQQ